MIVAKRKRILIGHSYWGRGGAEVAAMRLICALCRHFQVDVVTRGGFDLKELNRCSGTVIHCHEIHIINPPLVPMHNGMGGALWHSCFVRYCRHIAPQYALCITASRTLDWGMAAMHFLSDVTWHPDLRMRFNSVEGVTEDGLIRKAYFVMSDLLAGSSRRDPCRYDLFVANSIWTASISSEFCMRQPVVIYPPVPLCGVPAAWEGLANEFICLGRISPEKRIENVIAILDQVRVLGHELRLHLVGGGDDPDYVRQIRALCEARRGWVIFHGPTYGEDKQTLLARCRYGISACEIEAFGIATVEMAAAGILPFVPRRGAQAEIIRDPHLIYQDIEDAALKINDVMKSEDRQRVLRQTLIQRAQDFSPERFGIAVRDLVKRELECHKY